MPQHEDPELRRRRLDLEERCGRLGRNVLKPRMRSGEGFALVLFDLGEDGHIAYISSAQRADMIRALELLIPRLREGLD